MAADKAGALMSDTYTSGSGNWTPDFTGTVDVFIRGPGGGGGGGGSGGGSNGGSGGGGGGYCEVIGLACTNGVPIAYVVGIPGTGGDGGANGSAGTASTVAGGTYTANGGTGGLNGDEDNSVDTPGGTASGGTTNETGGDGTGVPSGDDGGAGGTGAGSGGPGGSGGIQSGVDALDGSAPGGGGGGGAKTEEPGGNGGAGEITFTPASLTDLTGGILRPIAGLDIDAGNSTWQTIDDVVTQPDSPGDLSYASYSGTSPGTTVEKFKVSAPFPGNTITGVRLWVLAHANFNSTMSLYTVQIKVSGTWNDLGTVNDALTTSPQWFYYELTGLTESSDSDDIGFELGINESTGTIGQAAKIDVAYMEVSYEETIPGDYAGAGSVLGADEFYGVGARSFEGYGDVSGEAEFSGTGLQPARGYGWVLGADDFSGVGSLPDSGYGPVTGTGYFYGVGRLPDSGYGSVTGAGVLSGTGSVPASSAVVRLRRAGIMAEW